MVVLEDDLGSEHTLENILEPMNAIWESGSGSKDRITLPCNCTHQRIQVHTSHFESVEVKRVM